MFILLLSYPIFIHFLIISCLYHIMRTKRTLEVFLNRLARVQIQPHDY